MSGYTIIDGDTLLTPEGQRIRIANINTREMSQPFQGKEGEAGAEQQRKALDYLVNKAGYNLPLTSQGKDVYDRDVQDFQNADGQKLSTVMLRSGLATLQDRSASRESTMLPTLGAVDEITRMKRGLPQTELDILTQDFRAAARSNPLMVKERAPDVRTANMYPEYYAGAELHRGDEDRQGYSKSPFSTGVGTSVDNLQAGLYGTVDLISRTLAGDGNAMSEWAKSNARANKDDASHGPNLRSFFKPDAQIDFTSAKSIKDNIDINSPGQAFDYAMGMLGSTAVYAVPTILGAMATGGTSLILNAIPAASYVGEAWNGQSDDNKNASRALISGVGQQILEKLGLKGSGIGAVTNKASFDLAVKALAKKEGISIAAATTKVDAITKITLMNTAKGILNTTGAALSEGVTESAQDLVADWGKGEEIDFGNKDTQRKIAESFIGGALVGTGIKTSVATRDAVKNIAFRADQNAYTGDYTPEMKAVMDNQSRLVNSANGNFAPKIELQGFENVNDAQLKMNQSNTVTDGPATLAEAGAKHTESVPGLLWDTLTAKGLGERVFTSLVGKDGKAKPITSAILSMVRGEGKNRILQGDSYESAIRQRNTDYLGGVNFNEAGKQLGVDGEGLENLLRETHRYNQTNGPLPMNSAKAVYLQQLYDNLNEGRENQKADAVAANKPVGNLDTMDSYLFGPSVTPEGETQVGPEKPLLIKLTERAQKNARANTMAQYFGDNGKTMMRYLNLAKANGELTEAEVNRAAFHLNRMLEISNGEYHADAVPKAVNQLIDYGTTGVVAAYMTKSLLSSITELASTSLGAPSFTKHIKDTISNFKTEYVEGMKDTKVARSLTGLMHKMQKHAMTVGDTDLQAKLDKWGEAYQGGDAQVKGKIIAEITDTLNKRFNTNFGKELLTDSGIYRANLTLNRFDPEQQAAAAGATMSLVKIFGIAAQNEASRIAVATQGIDVLQDDLMLLQEIPKDIRATVLATGKGLTRMQYSALRNLVGVGVDVNEWLNYLDTVTTDAKELYIKAKMYEGSSEVTPQEAALAENLKVAVTNLVLQRSVEPGVANLPAYLNDPRLRLFNTLVRYVNTLYSVFIPRLFSEIVSGGNYSKKVDAVSTMVMMLLFTMIGNYGKDFINWLGDEDDIEKLHRSMDPHKRALYGSGILGPFQRIAEVASPNIGEPFYGLTKVSKDTTAIGGALKSANKFVEDQSAIYKYGSNIAQGAYDLLEGEGTKGAEKLLKATPLAGSTGLIRMLLGKE